MSLRPFLISLWLVLFGVGFSFAKKNKNFLEKMESKFESKLPDLGFLGLGMGHHKTTHKTKSHNNEVDEGILYGLESKEIRHLSDFSTSYECNCVDCDCGKGCTTRCCSTCYNYYSYCTSGRYDAAGYVADGQTCTECPIGQYQGGSGGTSCPTCPAGTYAPSTLSASCPDCSAGTYSASTASSCTSCAAGTYSAATASGCTSCGAGTYTSTTGSSSCSSCSAGTYSPTMATSCVSCSAGTYSATGASSCTSCSVGTYTSSTGSTSCTACDEYKTSFEGGTSCHYFPSPVPTSLPTHSLPPTSVPTPVPTSIPTPVTWIPTIAPTACVDASPYCKLLKSFCASSFCPTCKQAHNCDVTCLYADCAAPSPLPSAAPTTLPSLVPTLAPTPVPSPFPTDSPTLFPTQLPTLVPSLQPTPLPTLHPSTTPTFSPSHTPTYAPTHIPTMNCVGIDPAQYMMTLTDAGNNGWHGVYITLQNSANAEVFSTTIAGGSTRRQWVCLTTDCYHIDINSTDTEIEWNFEDNSGRAVSGVAPTSDTVCTNATKWANVPTVEPTVSHDPTSVPTVEPSHFPSPRPTLVPSLNPTGHPTLPPTSLPTSLPTNSPTENCVDGQYIDTFSCVDCVAGQYSTVSMATGSNKFPQQCTACEVGEYSRTAATECKVCPVGKYSNLQRSDCVQCQSGQFVNATLQGCQNCSAGWYAPVALNDVCVSCGAGFATGVDENANSCDACVPGKYSKGDGVINVCLDCPSGFMSNARESTCTRCEAGTYASSSGSATCESCNKGTSTLGLTNATNCTDCPKGYYSDTRASVCQVCAKGTYAEAEGTPRCLECDSGTFAENNGSSHCAYCWNGTYQESSGQASCVNCEVGKYAPTKNAKFCTHCATGHVSLEGAALCDRCKAGYFWAFTEGKGWECEVCPYGASCDGNLNMPVAKDGYWINRDAAAQHPTFARNVYKCARDTCSKLPDSARRLATTTEQCKLLANFSSPSCINDNLFCAAGSKGPLCGACESGWNYNSGKRRCFPCGQTATWTESFASLGIVIVVIALLYSLRKGTIYVPPPLRRFTAGKSSLRIPVIGVFLWMNRAAVKLMVSTYQIVMSVSSNLEITFPEPYTTFGSWMSFVQLDFVNLDCMKGTYYQSVYTTCTFPIGVVGLVWSIFAIRWGIYRFRMKYFDGTEDRERDLEVYTNLKTQHINISLMVVFVVLPPVAKKQFRALDCVRLDDGSSYLRDDTSIDCHSFGYQRFAFINVLLILLWQSVPLIYIVLLCRVREKLVPLNNDESPEESLLRRDKDKSLDQLRFLFNDTKTNRWYFEVLEFYRRIVFTGVLPLTSKNTSIIAYLGSFLGMFSVIYFRELLPFRTEFTNFIAVVCQYVILLAFLAALMIETDSRDDLFRFTDLSFGLFLIGINLLIFALVIYGGHLRFSDSLKKDLSKKELKIEWAVHFTVAEFEAEIELAKKEVSSSHVLVYYYTSLAEAEEIIRNEGIPALKLHKSLTTLTNQRPRVNMETPRLANVIGQRGGVVVSLKPPHELDLDDTSIALMSPCAHTKEAVFCLSLPRSQLWCLESKSAASIPSSRSSSRSSRSSRRPSGRSLMSEQVTPIREVRGTSLDSVLMPNMELLKSIKYGQNSNFASISHLRLLPVELLEAMGSNHLTVSRIGRKSTSTPSPKSPLKPPKSPSPLFKNAAFGKPKVQEVEYVQRSEVEMQALNTRCVQCAFQLKDFEQIEGSRLEQADLKTFLCDQAELIESGVVHMSKPMKVFQPLNYEQYSTVLTSVREACHKLNLIPLYCYTSHAIAHDMKQRGIRSTPIDQPGIGVFFTYMSPCSLGFGTKRFEKNIIEHLYGSLAVSSESMGQGLFDFVIIYGAEPFCIEKSWSSNRVIYGQGDLIKTSEKKHFHLRRDRIMTALHLVNKEKLLPEIYDEDRLIESRLDDARAAVLTQTEREVELNMSNNSYRKSKEEDEWLFSQSPAAQKRKENMILTQTEFEHV